MKEDYLTIGRSALAVGAWEQARETLELAAQEEESAEVFEELAWAYWWLNDMAHVFEFREKAHRSFLEKNDKRGASRTASWMGLDYLEYKGEFAIANGWFQRAETLLDGLEKNREWCLIKTLKANLSFRVDKDIPKALMLLDDTIEVSKSIDAMECLMLAEALKGFVLVTVGKVHEGMELLDEATVLALSGNSGDIHMITTTCCFLIDACQRVRDYDRAAQWCIRVKEICKRWRHKAVFATCRTQYASVLISKGEWVEAEEELTRAIVELKALKPASVGMGMLHLAELRRRQGEWTEASAIFNEVKAGPQSLSRAALLYDMGEFDQAFEIIERILRHIPVHERTERIPGLELFIPICVRLKEMDLAEKSMIELESIANELNIPPLHAACRQAKGTLHHGHGNHDLARKELEDAIDLFEQLGAPFESARARVVLGAVLVELHKHDLAEAEINLAIKSFKKLGAVRDMEKARQQLKELGLGASNNQGFTRRELELLRLVADGKNNEEIADTLSISLRTVEKHLSNIYEKLGTSGKSARAHAASFASRKLFKK